MLNELHRVMREELPVLLANPGTPWNTLDVLYDTPHVQRVWLQLGDNRLSLHRIYPCEKAFFHPHPWPSAIHVLDGHYRMNLGYGPYSGPPPAVTATVDVGPGTSYEMVNMKGWHDVQPYGGTSLSVMLSGKPWILSGKLWEPPNPTASGVNGPLAEVVKNQIIGDVLVLVNEWSMNQP